MNCANHPDRPSTVTCHGCGKPFCDGCVVRFEKLSLCAGCKAKFLVGVDERPSSSPDARAGAPRPSTPASASAPGEGSSLPWIGGLLALAFSIIFVFVIVASLAGQYREWRADAHLAEAFDRVARVGAALESYRGDAGKYPDDLAVLVPKYLGAIPGDPYGGALHYAASSAGRRVWSVGPDGKDDHGEPPADVALLVDLPR